MVKRCARCAHSRSEHGVYGDPTACHRFDPIAPWWLRLLTWRPKRR